MSRNLNELFERNEDALDADRPDFCHNLVGIVAINDDPEHQHRIKCVLPWIDEDRVHDRWIRRGGAWFTGGSGYGDFHPPDIGTEVIVFGAHGQKYHLFYQPVYNENYIVAADFRAPTVRGFRTDGDYKAMADLDFQIRAGRLHIETDSTARIIAPAGFFINDKKVG